MTLDVSATVLERLDIPEQVDGEGADGTSATALEGDDEEDLVGAITIAVDVLDTPESA
jgi:hypothetical protein